MSKKHTILAIVGESGAGKTVLARFLQQQYNINNIVSYTTRPMRPEEINGIDHRFVEDPGCDVRTRFKTLAWTTFGGYQYWTKPEQAMHFYHNTYIIDEKGLYDLEENWSDQFNIVPVRVIRPHNPTEQSRKDRDADRVPYDKYQIVLYNDGSEREFLEKSGRIIATFFNKSLIAIDFDGTCVTHRCPLMGREIGAAPVLKHLTECGHSLVLNTMRDESMHLDDAIRWFEKREIPLAGVYKTSKQAFSQSPKCYAHLYIDDANVGIPLRYDDDRPYVDWVKLTQILKDAGYIEQNWNYVEG